MSPAARASEQYLVGFVSDDLCQGQDKEYYEVTLVRDHQVGNYTIDKLRKLPFFSSVHQGICFFSSRLLLKITSFI